MIKTLIRNYTIHNELKQIKKSLKVAKKHQSKIELNKVKLEILDLQGFLIQGDLYSEKLSNKILDIIEEIDFEIAILPKADFEW